MRLTKHAAFTWMMVRLIRLIVKVNARRSNMNTIHQMLNIVLTLFYPVFKRQFSAENSAFLSHHFTGRRDAAFIRRLLLNRLVTSYIRTFFAQANWEMGNHFLNRNCSVVREENAGKAKLLLCTHTGDYWLSVLMAAREYEGMGINFVIPIYEAVTEESQAMYERIDIAGVKIIFICIHNAGALKKITRWMKDPDTVVAIFYDLYCYSRGVYNGAVEPTRFFGRQAHMTTGIMHLAQRMQLNASLVSCHYSESAKHFRMEITAPAVWSSVDCARQEMMSWLESNIRRAPWQWHFIVSLDTYYYFPFSALQAWHSKNQNEFRRLNAKYTGQRS